MGASCQSFVVMWSFTVLCVVMCCWNTVSARPKEEQEEDVSLAESKDPETKPLDDLLAELRDSTIIPVLLNPFQITKLTCGSLITIYDTGATDATVAVDACLTALIVAKLVVVVPMIVGDINIQAAQGGVLGVWDRFMELLVTIKLAWDTARNDVLAKSGTGPEGEPFGDKSLDVEKEQNTFNKLGDFGFQYQDGGEYFGFGFDGWESGTQELPDFGGESLYKRGFPVENVELLLSSTLHSLERAVTVSGGAEF